MYAWSSNVTEGPFRTLGSDQIPTAANNYGGANPAKQKVLWADMQRIYADAIPVLPLFFRAAPHVTPVWLQGYVPTGHANMTSTSAENWHPG